MTSGVPSSLTPFLCRRSAKLEYPYGGSTRCFLFDPGVLAFLCEPALQMGESRLPLCRNERGHLERRCRRGREAAGPSSRGDRPRIRPLVDRTLCDREKSSRHLRPSDLVSTVRLSDVRTHVAGKDDARSEPNAFPPAPGCHREPLILLVIPGVSNPVSGRLHERSRRLHFRRGQ